MKSKRVIAAVVAFAVIVSGAWMFLRRSGSADVTYRFASIEHGDLESAVSATGTLNAVTTVQVGTQVSGQVAAIYVDFNDHVKQGQLLARIDPTLSEQAVSEAQAGLARSQAEVAQARETYNRNKSLYADKVVTDQEMSTAKYALDVAQANLRSSQVSLDRARRNLAYTEIYAPVDGIVVERKVDVGQTVAASLSAPELFSIAKDLSHMQILASVDESDIGAIKEGMPVHFTVPAYDKQTFNGVVKQVRLQSATTENVVSYTVAVDVANATGKLLPGMTATAEFVTGAAQNALLVPNAALRFKPTNAAKPDSAQMQAMRAKWAAARGAGGAKRTAGSSANKRGMVWVLGADKKPAPVRVTVGISDGTHTVVQGAQLKDGEQIIVAETSGNTKDAATTAASTNPLSGGQQSRGQRGPGGAF
jgi:HlyD family secretion protein